MLKVNRSLIGGLIALSAFALANPSHAQTNTGPTGRSVVVGDTLLGIRLEKDFMKDVLRHFGAPSEMLSGSPRLTDSMMPSKDSQNGAATGPSGSPYGSGGNNNPNPYGPYSPPKGGGGPGLPNFGGKGGGFGGNGNSQEDTKYVEKNEVTWWYHITRKGKPTLHYSFLFDKDGRVIQIQEYGFAEGGRTKEGVGLGDQLGDVLRRYGWSNDGERVETDKLTLRYGVSNKLAFQMVKNTVLGITLAKVK